MDNNSKNLRIFQVSLLLLAVTRPFGIARVFYSKKEPKLIAQIRQLLNVK
jgi:hypothetical protein